MCVNRGRKPAGKEGTVSKTCEQLVKEHGGVRAAARATGIPRSTFVKRLRKERAGHTAGKPDARKAGRSLAEFRSEYDKDYIIPAKIKAGIKELAGGWEYEVAFAKLAGVSLADLSAYRDAFAYHWFPIKRDGKRVWAATAELARKLKGMC